MSRVDRQKKRTAVSINNVSNSSNEGPVESVTPAPWELSDTVLAALETIDIPDSAKIDPKEYLATYDRVYQLVAHFDEPLRRCDMVRGEAAWLEGTILNLLKPIKPGGLGLIKHGEWQAFLNKHGINADTAENLRHIADQFTRIDARRLGYTNMVGIYKSDQQAAKGGKGTTARKAEATATERNAEQAGGQPRTLRLSEVPDKYKTLLCTMEFLNDEMPNAVDLLKDPERSMHVLDGLPLFKDQICKQAERLVRQAIPAAHAKLKQYTDEGHLPGIQQPLA